LPNNGFGFWISSEDEAAVAYLMPIALRLTGTLNVSALYWALQEVLNRHEVLRTGFTPAAGAALQTIAPAWDLQLPLTDLSTLSIEEREQEAETLPKRMRSPALTSPKALLSALPCSSWNPRIMYSW